MPWTIRKLAQGVDIPPKLCYSYLISQAKATTDTQSKLLLFYLTMEYIKLPSVSVTPEVSWFAKLPLPGGKSYTVTERRVLSLDSVTTVVNGFESNYYRAAGTDHINRDSLKSNISVNGVLISVQPPYALAGSLSLIDGYTRYQALRELGITHWVFNIVEPKEGFTEQQVRDEIGLGANNHPPSKAATQEDFKKRLGAWVSNFRSENEELPSLGNCIDWVNAIPHSFSQKQVTDFCEKVLKTHLCSNTVASFDAKRVEQFAAQHLVDLSDIIPLNASGNTTYYRRAVVAALESLDVDGPSPLVGFAHGTLAEEMPQVRKAAQVVVDRYNALFEKAFELRFRDSNFKLLDLQGFVPQIIDEEDPDTLVPPTQDA